MNMKLKITLFGMLSILFFYDLSAQCGADFEERNGIAVFEMESADRLGSGWRRETGSAGSGFTGSSFLFFRGTNAFRAPSLSTVITYKVRINSSGIYRFQWRNRVGIGNEGTEHNDSWVRFPDAFDFYAQRGSSIVYPNGGTFRRSRNVAEGDSRDGFMKVFRSGSASGYNWSARTNDGLGHDIFE